MRKTIIASTFAAAAIAGTVSMASPAQAYYYYNDAWQAVAYSPSTGEGGSAWNYPTAYGAMIAARNSCAYSDCYVVDVSVNSCASGAGVTVCPG